MTKLPRVCIVSPRRVASFIRQDADLLSTSFQTTLCPVAGIGSLATLYSALRTSDLVLIWFFGRHAIPALAMARMRSIPVIAIVGGFEVAWVPALRYGVPPDSIREHVLRWMIKMCQCVISVSESSQVELLSRFSHLVSKNLVIYNGVDTSLFAPTGPNRSGVISVGIINRETLGRKSWPLVADVARILPDTAFTIIGDACDDAGRKFVSQLPPNVTWRGVVGREVLIAELSAASVYLQPSIHEAFCVSLAEAMSCGCFPVVSSRAAFPEVVAGTGYCVDELSPTALAEAVSRALARDPAERETVRASVIERFDTSHRRTRLEAVLRQLIAEQCRVVFD